MSDMTDFQRARTDEQRQARRRAILDTAAAMLAEMPVAEVSLNELSRRVGLAKSNVLRYFESREAVLLELLGAAWQDWLESLAGKLAAAVDQSAPVTERGDQLAAAMAGSLADRPVLCDLISAQSAVLERNISPQVAAEFKRAAIANVVAVSQLVLESLPELGDADAGKLVAAALMSVGALWTNCRPSAAMQSAYDDDPALASMQFEFTAALREMLEVLIAGLFARSRIAESSSFAFGTRPVDKQF